VSAVAAAERASPQDDVLEALARLDVVLERAIRAAEQVHGVALGEDPHRGLYVSPADARRLVGRSPGAPLYAGGRPASGSSLAGVREAFDLTAFDVDVVLVALAPEVDLRYERLYAYLQDDVTRRRPSVDLALDLLCRSAPEKLAQRARFTRDAPLLAHRLLRLVPEGGRTEAPLLAHALVLDALVVRMLLGIPGGDARLSGLAELVEPEAGPADERERALVRLAAEARGRRAATLLSFEGPSRSGRRRAALALARALDERLLVLDLERLRERPDAEELTELALAEARLRRAVPYVERADAVDADEGRRLAAALARHRDVAVVAAADRPSWLPPDAVSVEFGPLEPEARLERWSTRAAEAGVEATESDLQSLATRFRFSAGEVDDAVAAAGARARWRAAHAGGVPVAGVHDLFTGARAQSAPRLGRLAAKIEPRVGWDDIVLPPDRLAQLREIVAEAAYRDVVYGDWCFGRKLSLGKGLNALFSGSPGTGKTMAAEVIAGALGLDLYKIDLSQIVSKYIGETERNLAEVFREAAATTAILFFDEADALFGKRSEVRDAHDRYANIEIAYLLQKMEEYEGPVVLATNVRQNVDEAFLRRLHHIVEFPDPDESHRRRIWAVTFPEQAPLGDDVDFALLAREIVLPGGNIRNMALAAAFVAAADGGVIRLPHLEQAARREFEKLGRAWDARGFGARVAT
jgi:ATPase family associated with various cellular activities (AAA)